MQSLLDEMQDLQRPVGMADFEGINNAGIMIKKAFKTVQFSFFKYNQFFFVSSFFFCLLKNRSGWGFYKV